MKILRQSIVLLIIMVFTISFRAQAQEKISNIRVSETKATWLGQSDPIKELIKKSATTKDKRQKFKRDRKKPDNFKNRRGTSKASIGALEHLGPDPIRQTDFSLGLRPSSGPIVNIDGLTSGPPNDPTGDIGLDYYLQAINATRVAVFDKEGNEVEQFPMNTLWSQFNASSLGDPIILFDQDAKRWLITEFTGPANMLLAYSDTSDPLGSYNAWSFATPSFPDYPKFGIWPNAIVITTNEGGPGVLHNYLLDRQAMLNGESDITMQRVEIQGNNSTEAGFFVSTPLDWNGALYPTEADRPMVMILDDSSWGSIAEDAIQIYRFDIDWTDVNNTSVSNNTLTTTPYDGFPCSATGMNFECVPQLDGMGLDAIPELIMNIPYYRNFGTHETIVFSFITDVTDGNNISGIRWMELRKTDTEDWNIYQEGTFALDDGLDRFMSSIAIDKNGNIGLAYNVTSADSYVGVRYTGRFSTDPLGVMTLEEFNVIEGQNSINSGGRFGDYAQMGVDPVDGNTFWYTTEYAGGGSTNTRIIAFEFAKDTFDLAVLAIIDPQSTSSSFTDQEEVTIELINNGIEDISDFVLTYNLDGSQIESKDIDTLLVAGARYRHTFDITVDLSNIGDYVISATVENELDQNPNNNRINKHLSMIQVLEAGVKMSLASISCAQSNDVKLTLENFGFNPIAEANILITINGNEEINDLWNGNILSMETEEITYTLNNFISGVNEVSAEIISINGDIDANPNNNLVSAEIEISEEAGSVDVSITSDFFPAEISWVITTISGIIVGQGDDYTAVNQTITDNICLVAGECYTFYLYDSFGDGIFGQGGYSISDNAGNVLVFGDGNFAFDTSAVFCPGVDCMVSANADIIDATSITASDGSILLEGINGMAPYQYSIDGGETFQQDGLFEDLACSLYEVVVTSHEGFCVYSNILEVKCPSLVDENILKENDLKILPNPNNGFFSIELHHASTSKYAIMMQVLDNTGKIIQSRYVNKYNNIFTSQVSLVDYPNGNYYIQFIDEDLKAFARVIKQ